MPDWAEMLEMAGEWHIPPWDIEAELPALWRDRWVAMRNAQYEKQKRDNPKQTKTGARKLI